LTNGLAGSQNGALLTIEWETMGGTLMNFRLSRRVVLAGALAIAFTANTSANHNWLKYHWKITTSVVSLQVGDNVDNRWEAYLTEALYDWNGSAVLDLDKTAGGSSPETCGPTAGRIEACNWAYGTNGWLGIAQIWITSGNHISQAVTKLNDSYFETATYNTPAWRRMVTCQEIAHDFGLDHQDERFTNANLGSCMDYTNDPDGGPGGAVNDDPSNEHPNQHDFDQLLTIYGHDDSASGPGKPGGGHGRPARAEAASWGRLIRSNANNRVQVYEQDLGNGNRLITHVFWADPEADRQGHDH
jgi:hypothetical protein